MVMYLVLGLVIVALRSDPKKVSDAYRHSAGPEYRDNMIMRNIAYVLGIIVLVAIWPVAIYEDIKDLFTY